MIGFGFQPRLELLKFFSEFRRLGCDDGSAEDLRRKISLQLGGEVGQLRPRKTSGERQQFFNLLRELFAGLSREQEKFHILGGARQRSLARTECSPALGNDAFKDNV